MNTVSKALLSALLLAGVAGGALVAEPAAAQKKEKPKQPKLSPDVLKPLQAAEAALKANDTATAEPAIAQAEAAAKTDDDRYFAASLRINLEQQKIKAARAANPNAAVDQQRIAAPLQILLAAPQTGQAEKAQFATILGQLAYERKAYPQALQYFQQAKQLGSTDPNLDLNIVRVREQTGDAAGALADLNQRFERQLAAGQKPSDDEFRYGLSRALKSPGAALPMMKRYLSAYPTAKNWRDMLVLYGLQQGSVATLDTPQKIDLFRLMNDTNSLADQYDYMDYASKLRDRGLPVEARKVLQKGIAAGKVPSANTEARAMQGELAKFIASEGPLGPLEAKAAASRDGKLSAQTADAYLSQENNAKAAELYRQALQKGGVNADEVNTRLGIALSRQGDKAGARAAFTAVQGQPRQGLAQLWLTHLDAPTTA